MGILLLYCMLYIGLNYHMASNLERGTRSNKWMDGWLAGVGDEQTEGLPNKDADVDWSTRKLETGPGTVISLFINTLPSDKRNPVFARRGIGWCTTISTHRV
jgi:hypothetical protein